ncbi:hypothetical protein T458_22290 [Brevibacillus panacihumi W25]|uniref:Uncharacterized protein n=1 Tax=Brevibacillus panacihumi W25 TaxID=1408254 RepID=V6MEZ1_9BACL|nr:hypothetical protein T458_22290 [Brevibacillus panacihumi W25]
MKILIAIIAVAGLLTALAALYVSLKNRRDR